MLDLFNVNNRVILITGASSGIGASAANMFAAAAKGGGVAR